MGIFNRNNKKREIQENVVTQPVKPSSNVEYNITPDGRLQIDYYDPNADFKQFYDTTRLIVGKSRNIAGYNVSECQVSWYGSTDCQYFDRGKEFGRRVDYSKILTQLDINLLYQDPRYLEIVMKDLLEQKRVEGYLQRGMQDSPANPCGQYIGEVTRDYIKVFRQPIGNIAHNLPEMIHKRKRDKERRRALREETINRYKQEILKLQSDDPDGR